MTVPALVGMCVLLFILYFGAACAKTAAMFPSFLPSAKTPAEAPPGASRLALATGAEAFFLPGRGVSADAPGALAVLAHGNAETVCSLFEDMARYRDLGVSALAVEYRGYGATKGAACPRNVRRDTLQLVARAAAIPGVDSARVVLHGRSIGAAVACDVAKHLPVPPAALILQSAFTSVKDLARKIAPAVAWLVPASDYDNLGHIAAHPRTPLLLIHGKDDALVPVDHAFQLRRASRKCTFVGKDAGHNDVPPSWDEVRAFLEKHEIVPRPEPQPAARPELKLKLEPQPAPELKPEPQPQPQPAPEPEPQTPPAANSDSDSAEIETA